MSRLTTYNGIEDLLTDKTLPQYLRDDCFNTYLENISNTYDRRYSFKQCEKIIFNYVVDNLKHHSEREKTWLYKMERKIKKVFR